MGASINGVPLAVNPRGVAWDYKMKISTQKTIGGKVIQLLGWNMGDLVVTGQYGFNGPARQKEFFKQLAAIADSQVPVIGEAAPQPVRFLWPEKNWDFWVFIKSLTQNGSPVAIERTNAMHSPEYTLTMFVYEDNGEIVQAIGSSAAAKYLQRITAGMGWAQTDWNGPTTIEEVQQRLGGATLFSYLYTPLPTPELQYRAAGDG